MFVVFDIEATGFSSSTCDVIQFAYILFDDNNNFLQSEKLYFYYKGMSWSEEAYQVHQIPLSLLEQHEDKFQENLIKMYTVLNNNNVVGHNSTGYDCPFVRGWLMRMGITNLNYGLVFDTMKAYKPITKRSKIKLIKLAEMMNVTPTAVEYMMDMWFPQYDNSEDKHSHDAAYDTTMTAILTLQAIQKKLINFDVKAQGPSTELVDTSSFYEQNGVKIVPNTIYIPVADSSYDQVEFHMYCKDEESMKDKHTLVEEDMWSRRHFCGIFPHTLYRVDVTDVFKAEVNGITYTYDIGGKFDVLTLTNSFGTFDCKDLDMMKFIESLKGVTNG